MTGDGGVGRPEAAGTQQLVPREWQVAAGEVGGIGLHQRLGGIHPVLQVRVAQVHGPQLLRTSQVHPAHLLTSLLRRDPLGGRQPGGAEEVVRYDRDPETRQSHGQQVGDVPVLGDLEVGGQATAERARGEAQHTQHLQLPQTAGEVGSEVAEGHRVDLVGLAQPHHLLDQPLPLCEAGDVRVDIVLHIGAAVAGGENAHQHVHHRVGHSFGGDGLHLADGRDGDGLLESELAVLTAADTNAVVPTVDLEGHGLEVALGEELAGRHVRDATEVGHGDAPEEGGFEPDHGAGHHTTDPVARGPAEQVQEAAMDGSRHVLEHQTRGDVAIPRGFVVREAQVDAHATGGHGAHIHQGDAGLRDRLEDAEDVVANGTHDVRGAGSEAGDVDAVDDRDRVVRGHECLHVAGFEHVHVLPGIVGDAGDGVGVGSPIDDHDVEEREATAQQTTRHRVAHQAAPPEDDDGSVIHGNLHELVVTHVCRSRTTTVLSAAALCLKKKQMSTILRMIN